MDKILVLAVGHEIAPPAVVAARHDDPLSKERRQTIQLAADSEIDIALAYAIYGNGAAVKAAVPLIDYQHRPLFAQLDDLQSPFD